MLYIGDLGRLLPLDCASEQATGTADTYTYSTTLEGRVLAQRSTNARRQWSITTDVSTGRERVLLDEVARGLWGRGPFVWVPVDAQQGNGLTPEQAALDTAPVAYLPGGPVETVDGWTGASLVASTSATTGIVLVAQRVPALPGVAVTGSVDVIAHQGAGAPQVIVRAVDASGAFLGAATRNGAASTDPQRISATLVPPAGTAWVRLEVRYSARVIARPQVTWSKGPAPYHPPAGCAAAVLDPPQVSLLTGWEGSAMLASTTYTVREVG